MKRKIIESELATRFKNGDEDAFVELVEMCKDKMEKLYEQYRDVTLHIEKEEYVSAMVEGLLRAVNVYKDSYPVRISFYSQMYMAQCIKKLHLQYMRYECDATDIPCADDPLCEQMLDDIIDILNNDKSLPSLHCDILKHRYFHNLTYREIGKLVHLSDTRIHQIEQNMLNKLRHRLSIRKYKRMMGEDI